LNRPAKWQCAIRAFNLAEKEIEHRSGGRVCTMQQ
jgi:hypothetical protein